MRTSLIANEPRTFRSGAYLDGLFRSAERMDEQLQREICARIKQARVEAGFTQGEAADVIGVTLRAYQNYESVRVPFRTLSRVAEIFGVAESWLLRGGELERAGDLRDRLAEIRAAVDGSAEATAASIEALARGIAELNERLEQLAASTRKAV